MSNVRGCSRSSPTGQLAEPVPSVKLHGTATENAKHGHGLRTNRRVDERKMPSEIRSSKYMSLLRAQGRVHYDLQQQWVRLRPL
jgi:hypothetical protein